MKTCEKLKYRSSMNRKTLLIVDDDKAHCDSLEDILIEEGFEIFSAGTCAGAVKIASEKMPQVALLDIKLPDGSGTDLLATLKKMNPDLLCIMITAYADLDSAITALADGAYQYLHKPFRMEELLQILKCASETVILKDENKKAIQALKESEQKYRTILGSIEEGYYEIDISGNLTFFNNSLCRILGYSKQELMEMDLRHLMDEENVTKAAELVDIALKTKLLTRVFGWQLYRKDRTTCFVEISVSFMKDSRKQITGFKGIVRDVTKKKRAEEERKALDARLNQTQKMEAIGTLAGGIAHDFNNILSAIIGYTELSLLNLTKEGKIRSHLDKVLTASQRAKDLVSQILSFSRQAEIEMRPVHVGLIVNEALKLIRATLPSTIKINKNIAENTGRIMGEPAQIHQVLMNLCTNAAHAMQEKGGKLDVTIEETSILHNSSVYYPNLKPGEYIKISVRDTGDGIDPEIKERIFEPFFTTKEKGKGTGMGLSVVHGIVRSHKGDVMFKSEPPNGTTFEVLLPKITQNNMSEYSPNHKRVSTGNERILFIDDEESLANLGQQILNHLGYQVTTIVSSTEALKEFRARPDDFDLVITDQTMPNITGMELAREFLRIRPNMPIILCSGYSDQVTKERLKASGIRRYVMKPFAKGEIAEIIRNVLD
jgi:PAS domain S-box-containing protein